MTQNIGQKNGKSSSSKYIQFVEWAYGHKLWGCDKKVGWVLNGCNESISNKKGVTVEIFHVFWFENSCVLPNVSGV